MNARRFTRRSILLRALLLAVAALATCFPAFSSSKAFAQQSQIFLAHYSVSTHDVGAQREFDEGLTLLYAFNPEEATFHFQEAARRDPLLAMAYWGIGIAAGPNVNTDYDLERAAIGRAAVAQATALDARATPVERGLIAALAVRYTAAITAQILPAEAAYAKAMGALEQRYPRDVDVETLYAESLMDLTPLAYWRSDGEPTQYTHAIAGLLTDVLSRQPRHIGANHFLIHLYEYSPTPQAALTSARQLSAMTFDPGAEHLAHMPAHIFVRVGDYDDAIRSSLAAAAMFAKYAAQQHSDVHDGYFHHDLQVLNYAYMMSGQWSKARDTAGEIADQVQDNGAAVETYLRFHRYRELLALPSPAQPGLRWRFAQGMAQAGTGDVRSAQSQIDWIASLGDRDPRTAIAHASLVAAVAIAQRHDDVAVDALRGAVTFEDRLQLKEPPAWFYPIRETLGARLALLHRYSDAQSVFEDDLRRNPGNGRSLFGLAAILARSNPRRAEAVRAQFKRAWRHADNGLSLSAL